MVKTGEVLKMGCVTQTTGMMHARYSKERYIGLVPKASKVTKKVTSISAMQVVMRVFPKSGACTNVMQAISAMAFQLCIEVPLEHVFQLQAFSTCLECPTVELSVNSSIKLFGLMELWAK